MYVLNDNETRQARRNLHEQIAHDIGCQIVKGGYRESELLPTEVELADRYCVSRTAVREAFRILSAKGLTSSRPKIGTRVRARADWNMMDPDILAWHLMDVPTSGFVSSLFELRALIEPHAAALAAERRTERHVKQLAQALQAMQKMGAPRDSLVNADLSFHHTILEAAGNPLFRNIGTTIEALMRYQPGSSLPADCPQAEKQDVTGVNPTTRRHAAIYVAIRDRNPRAAREAVADLVATVQKECARQIASSEQAALETVG